MKTWPVKMIFFSLIQSSLQATQPEIYTKYVYNCVPGGSWLFLLICVLIILLFYTSHTKKNDYYENQIQKLKLENELLVLRAEYETHKTVHERSLSELRQINSNVISELTFLKNNNNNNNNNHHAHMTRSDAIGNDKFATDKEHYTDHHGSKYNKPSWPEQCDCRSNKTWSDDYEDLIACDIKRRRFGQLRRSVSTSSLPSEHDETPTSSPPPEKCDTAESSVDSVEDFGSSPPSPTKEKLTSTRNVSYLRIPDITITDMVALRNFENFTSHAAKIK